MVIFGFLLVLIIPFAVGVPVGMCIKKGHSASASASDSDASATASASASASASISASATATDSSAASPSASASSNDTAASPPTAVWQPAVGATWQISLSQPITMENGKPSPDVDIYDVDLFDADASTISALHAAGKKVICYFSAGTYEDWRSDKGEWDSGDFGQDMPDWPGEKWVNTRSDKVRSVMAKRIALAASKGCDAVDPDNVDAYDNENGLGLTAADATDYVKFLAGESRKHNLSCGLKNAAAIVRDVAGDVHFSVVEQCAEQGECASYRPMIDEAKPVFAIEYPSQAGTEMPADAAPAACAADGSDKFSTVLKKMNLDTWVQPCEFQFDM